MDPLAIKHFEKQASAYQEQSTGLWWSWLRKRESKAVLKALGPLSGEIVLDLGCGAGYYTRLALQCGALHVVSVDAASPMIQALPDHNVTGVLADATQVQLDQTFEKILCAGLLEFIPDTHAFLTNARTLVTDAGVMSLLVPSQNLWVSCYRSYHARHGIKVNTFSESSLTQLGKSCGWRVENVQFVFPFSLIFRLQPD